MAGVSGGGWFVSGFGYDQDAGDTEALLCPYLSPGNLTLDAVAAFPDA